MIPDGFQERLTAGRRLAVAAGRRPAGTVPYGYRAAGPTLEIVPEEAELVRRIFRLYLGHRGSILKIERQLAADGQLTRNGKAWSKAGLAWLLKNDTYLGRVHMGALRVRGQHPAIVANVVFHKVQKRLRRQRKRNRLSAHSVA